MKHFSLPKLLLCHYSSYFDRCFNSCFSEAKTQKLDLPEDNVEDFELLVEWMVYGILSKETLEKRKQTDWATSMALIEYADIYGLGEAAEAVALNSYKEDFLANVCAEDISLVFRVFRDGHRLRQIAVQHALRNSCEHYSNNVWGTVAPFSAWENEEDTVEGFAAEHLRQLREGAQLIHYIDPITEQLWHLSQ